MEPTIEIAILVITATPLVRLLLKRPVRRELRERPSLLVVSIVAALACIAFVAWATLQSIFVLRLCAIGAMTATVIAYVRARPHYGRSRGLPPGSLGLAASIDSVSDERYYTRQAERWGPVFKMSQVHRPLVCVVDLALGLEFIEANRTRLRQSALPFAKLIPGSYIEFMNGEHHERFRAILRPALMGATINDSRPYVAAVSHEVLAEMAMQGGERGVKPGEFLDRIVFATVLRVLFGVSRGDPRFERFQKIYALIDCAVGSRAGTHGPLAAAFDEAVTEARAMIDELRSVPADRGDRSALSEVSRSIPASDDERLLTTAIGNLVFLMAIARDDLQGFLMWVLKMCCDHPEATAELTGPSERTRSRIANIVKETVRLRQSEYVYREVVEECQLGDYRIPKGWGVRLCLAECHRLGAIFANPEHFDPGRFEERSYPKTEYCPFGDGYHACIGTGLVAMATEAFLVELTSGFAWRTVADGPVVRGNRHWHHWTPNARFRVALSKQRRQPVQSG